MDLGGGSFRGVIPHHSFILIPPGFATTILVDGDHGIEVLALPYARLRALTAGLGADLLPEDGDFGRLHAGCLSDDRFSWILAQLWHEARGWQFPKGHSRPTGSSFRWRQAYCGCVTAKRKPRWPAAASRLGACTAASTTFTPTWPTT
jgi:hypothetical protein